MSPVTPPFWMTFARFNIVGALGIGRATFYRWWREAGLGGGEE